MKESELLKKILLRFREWKIFRNDTGLAYQGVVNKLNGKTIVLNAKPIKYGLINGSSDLIGWRKIDVTKEMVGTSIAQFVAIEAKTKNVSVTTDQKTFLLNIKKDGGVALIIKESKDGELKFYEPE